MRHYFIILVLPLMCSCAGRPATGAPPRAPAQAQTSPPAVGTDQSEQGTESTETDEQHADVSEESVEEGSESEAPKEDVPVLPDDVIELLEYLAERNAYDDVFGVARAGRLDPDKLRPYLDDTIEFRNVNKDNALILKREDALGRVARRGPPFSPLSHIGYIYFVFAKKYRRRGFLGVTRTGENDAVVTLGDYYRLTFVYREGKHRLHLSEYVQHEGH